MGDTEKRLVVFLILSVAIVYLFTLFMPPVPPPHPTQTGPAASNPLQMTTAPTMAVGQAPTPGQSVPATPATIVTIDTPLYQAQFTSTGGVLTRWELKTYTETVNGSDPVVLYPPAEAPTRAPLSLIIPGLDSTQLDHAAYRLEGGNAELNKDRPSARILFIADFPAPDRADQKIHIEKELLFHDDTYRVDLAVRVDGTSVPYQLTLGDNFALYQDKGSQSSIGHRGAVSLVNDELVLDKPEKMASTSLTHSGVVRWTALEGKYFIAALIPRIPVGEAVSTRTDSHGIIAGLIIPPGQRQELALYAGPKEYKRLTALDTGLERTIDFGWFMAWSLTLVQIIAKPLFLLLQFVHEYTHNYGTAIILITVMIKLLFVPLTHKSYTSMKAMQTLQPKMAELQKKYKDDKERFNKELFLLYKTHKVNPLGGCLPMLLQVPVFVAFFNILYTTIELRHAPFILWVHDLSSQDPYYVLPIIMGITMFVQQKIQPSAMDPRQAKMMLLLPVVFTFFFLNFPAGLVLYWMFNNLLTILQQYVTLKLQPTSAALTS